MAGKLFVVGVGPGDAGLITVKAAHIFETVKHVFVPVSGEGRSSLAYEISSRYISGNTNVTELLFPMQKNKDSIREHYIANFKKIEAVLRAGKDAAIITIGDPSTYSTAWPVLNLLREEASDIELEIIPGITSYAAGAASTGEALAEGNEIMSVVSSYDLPDRIEAVIDVSDTVVFLKTYKKRDIIVDLLRKKGLIEHCVYIKRCGLEGEEVIYNLDRLPEEIDYFSMFILKKRKETAGLLFEK
jgi:precorrin-2/cobalt-factor-2 C20-methyltransferase